MGTIKKVSEVAGVSTATVSRALQHPDLVTAKTRARVLAAVEATNYRPNHSARSLRMQRSFTFVVIVPDISNPFFAQVIRGAEQVATAAGYKVLLGDSGGDVEKESALARLLLTLQADGILQFSDHIPEPLRAPDGGLNPGINFVNVCELIDFGTIASVGIDNAAAAATMIEYLTQLGHRQITIVRGPANSPLTQERSRGAIEAFVTAGFDPAMLSWIDGDFSISSGILAAARILDNPPGTSAVFCLNDEMAIGVMHGLRMGGIDVPGQISVAGFDDIEFASYCAPTLTTIAQPKRDIGQAAMQMLLAKVEGLTGQPEKVVLPTRLVPRQSTGRAAV